MTIKIPSESIEQTDKKVFQFLANADNFKSLMPKNLTFFEKQSETSFCFALEGMPKISIALAQQTPHSYLKYNSSEKPIVLEFYIERISETQTAVSCQFEGNFNTMISMMVKKPLTSFLKTLLQNLKDI